MRKFLIVLFVSILFCSGSFAQGDFDLPVLETFENKNPWPWAPWIRVSSFSSAQTANSAHTGKFGLSMSSDVLYRTDTIVGKPGQVISWWIRFEGPSWMFCGFGSRSSQDLNSRNFYYLCVDPSTQTLHFSSTPDYTYPPLKMVPQTYKMNIWYRVEVVYNTATNVTGKLYSTNGKTLLNSITVDLPELKLGGIAFSGNMVHVDDIKGGTRMVKAPTETPLAPKIGERIVLKNIQFESDKSILLPSSYAELNELVGYLKKNPNTKIEISGYTDNSGNEKQNKNLSQARAQSVADYLIQHGIVKTNINPVGYGSSKPIATNETEEGRQKNRRVEFLISQN
jgi:outer membrane protein OmpA-like peptidoglycan-associated protein